MIARTITDWGGVDCTGGGGESTTTITIQVDYENNAEAWWDAAAVAAKEHTVAGEVFRALLRSDEVRLASEDYAAWLQVARQLPSWNNGSSYAPCPVTMSSKSPEPARSWVDLSGPWWAQSARPHPTVSTMSKKKSRAELEQEVQDLSAYQEAFWALQKGEKPVKLTSGPESVRLLGAGRACGGVVLLDADGCCVRYAEKWSIVAQHSFSPYLADLARQVQRAVAEGVKRRLEVAPKKQI